MMHVITKNLWNAASLIALMAVPSVVQAQTAPQNDAAASGEENSGIADIIVTATRRQENLQSTAVAVTAITSDQIAARGVNNVSDLTRLVPAAKIGQLAGSSVQVTVRGIGNFGGNSFAEPGVSFTLDGVYLARSAGASGIFYDIDRVEMLKGPQGTLYGRNSTGGVLNLITKDPGKDAGFDFSGEYGNGNRVRVEAGVTVPLSDTLSVRVAGQRTKSDGFTPDGGGSEDNYAGRIKVKFAPSTALSVLLEADYAKVNDGILMGGFRVPGYNPYRDISSGPTSLQNTVIAASPLAPALARIQGDSFNDNKARGLQATVNYDFGPATSTLIVANRRSTNHYLHYGAGFPVLEDNRGDPSEYTTAELRFASSHGGPFKWVLGGFYFDDELHTKLDLDQGVSYQYSDVRITTKSYSGFAEGSYSVLPAVRLTAGGRYTSDKKEITGVATGPIGIPFAPFGGLPSAAVAAAACPTYLPGVSYSGAPGFGPRLPNPYFGGSCTTPIAGQKTFSKFTWKLGVEADVGSHSLLYATVSTGFKAGGFYASLDTSGIAAVPANQRQGNSYLPETLTAYTIGSKNRFFDNSLQINAELFYWKYKNKQLSHLGVVQPGNFYNLIVDNAGAAEIYGAEVDAQWQPTPSDNLALNVQYVHADYTRFTYAALFQGPAPVTSCPFGAITPGRFNSTVVDCSGRPVSFAPRWAINLGYNHIFDLNGAGRIIAGLSSQIQSSFYVGEEFLKDQRQKSSSVSNAELTWQTQDRQLGITAFVKNIEQTRVLTSSFVYPFGGAVRQALGLPRTYGARMTLKF